MISIIIIVKNDRRIARLLEALPGIEKPENSEVIVVDASQGALADIKKLYSYARWITFVNKHNKKTTIPDQRNVGIQNAKGDIIAFIDSDCMPNKKWLEELVKPIRSEKENIVAGKVAFSGKNSLHAIEFSKNKERKYIEEAPTMNLAISKNIIKEIGLFDEEFQCGEDVDFLWRATSKGYKIRFQQSAVIYHDLGTLQNEMRRMYVYGGARTKLYRKHVYRWRLFYGNEIFSTLYPIYFLLLPLTFVIKYYPILIFIPFLKYIHKDPFKVILLKTVYGSGMLKELVLKSNEK